MMRVQSLEGIPSGSHLLVEVDPATGHVLDYEGNSATGGEMYYLCFPSEALAREYASQRFTQQRIAELFLLDANGDQVARLVDPETVAKHAQGEQDARTRAEPSRRRRLFRM